MSNFSVTFRERTTVHVLELRGELDAHTAHDFEAAIEKCIDARHHRIVVNGAELDYISSAGLGVFMAYIEEIREQGGTSKLPPCKIKSTMCSTCSASR